MKEMLFPFVFIIWYSLFFFLVGYFSWKAIKKLFSTKLIKSSIAHRVLITIKTTYYVILFLVWILWILTYFGIDIKTLITWVGVSWLIFTLVWKDYLTNFFSSVTFLMNWVFKIWDRIKIWSIEGKVLDITINYVILQNEAWEKVFFPNKKLSWEPIEHLSTK